jgi:hypothetical protein
LAPIQPPLPPLVAFSGPSLDEPMAHLGLHEIDLEVREVALAEEVESGLRRPDGRDLLAELDEAHARVRGAADDRATEAKRLSRQLARVGKVLIDLDLPPINNIPQLPQMARDALMLVTLVVERLQEALDFGVGP